MPVTFESSAGNLTVLVSGEVDHHSAGDLMRRVQRTLEEQLPGSVIFDLSGVTFMDSSGIALLLRVYRTAARSGARLTVRSVPPQAGRVLQAAGLQRLIRFT